MRAEEVHTEIIESAKIAWKREALECIRSRGEILDTDDVARILIADAYPLIARRVLEEAAQPWERVTGSDTPLIAPAVADWLMERAAAIAAEGQGDGEGA